MKKSHAALAFYGVLIAGGLCIAWFGAPRLTAVISAASLGAGLTAVFGALYIGELKTESIGQLYQALAAANLRSADQAQFSRQSLTRVRTIRRIFLVSNVVKLVGAVAALYVATEKNADAAVLIGVVRASLGALALSLILFTRLWAEVSSTEALLLAVKEESLIQSRREEFLAAGRSAKPYDFESDPAAKSFENDSHAPLMMPSSK